MWVLLLLDSQRNHDSASFLLPPEPHWDHPPLLSLCPCILTLRVLTYRREGPPVTPNPAYMLGTLLQRTWPASLPTYPLLHAQWWVHWVVGWPLAESVRKNLALLEVVGLPRVKDQRSEVPVAWKSPLRLLWNPFARSVCPWPYCECPSAHLLFSHTSCFKPDQLL